MTINAISSGLTATIPAAVDFAVQEYLQPHLIKALKAGSLPRFFGILAAPMAAAAAAAVVFCPSKFGKLAIGLYVSYKCFQIFRGFLVAWKANSPLPPLPVSQRLNLEGRDLTVWPEVDCYVHSLQLNYNRLTTIPQLSPERLEQFEHMQILMLWGNRLTQFPTGVLQFQKLQELHLSDNLIGTLPAEITRLAQLRILVLYDTQLTELPTEIGQLPLLELLNLNHNLITRLPSTLSRLSKLKNLLLMDNRLTELPDEIGQLPMLEELKLDGNQLRTVPASLGRLRRLRSLQLERNRFTELPASLADISREGVILAGHQGRLVNVAALRARLQAQQNRPRLDLYEPVTVRQIVTASFPPNEINAGELEAIERSVETYLRENQERAAAQSQEGVSLLQSLIEQHLATLSEEKRAEYREKILDGDTEVMVDCPRFVVAHFLAVEGALTTKNTPFFMHSHLSELNTLIQMIRENKPDPENKIKTLRDTITTTLHREAQFIVCIQGALSHFQ